jgi:hypothetical protein
MVALGIVMMDAFLQHSGTIELMMEYLSGIAMKSVRPMSTKHKNFHPAICGMLDIFDELYLCALVRSKTIIKDGVEVDEITRAKAEATASAYAFMKMMLMQMDKEL